MRYTGDPLDIGFNANYLLEILRYIPTEEVRLTFKAPERAATVEPEGWADQGSTSVSSCRCDWSTDRRWRVSAVR